MRRASISTIVKLIIVVVVLIVVALFGTTLYAQVFAKSEDEICRVSVAQHAASKLISPVQKKGFEIQCPRKEIVFYQDQVTLGGKRIAVFQNSGDKNPVSKFKALNEHIVNQVLAKELYSCWKKMGAGSLDVFNPDFLLTKNTPCIVCSTVSFQETGSKSYGTLMDYLKTYRPSNENNYYYDYLNVPQPAYLELNSINSYIPYAHYFMDRQNSLQLPPSLDPSKSYTLFFYGFKPSRIDAFFDVPSSYHLFMTETADMSRCSAILN